MTSVLDTQTSSPTEGARLAQSAIASPTAGVPTGAPPASGSGRSRRKVALPGMESMAKPWRYGVIGVGLALGLVPRLFIANGLLSTIDSVAVVYLSAITSLFVAIGLLLIASERDRFDQWMALLAVGLGLALGSFQWISPNFAANTADWSDRTQTAMAALGFSNGLLIAGILTVAFARRWPTLSVVAIMVAGVLTLLGHTTLLRNEWPAIAALLLAFAGVLRAWDQAPLHEPRYTAATDSPRISRAALSLAIIVISGSVIQIWASQRDGVDQPLPALLLSVAVLVLAFLALIRVRREIQRRETTMSEWASWMREIRTGEFRSDFERHGHSGGMPIGHLEPEAPRQLSFPDLQAPPLAQQAPFPAWAQETEGPPADTAATLPADTAATLPADAAYDWQSYEPHYPQELEIAFPTEANPADDNSDPDTGEPTRHPGSARAADPSQPQPAPAVVPAGPGAGAFSSLLAGPPPAPAHTPTEWAPSTPDDVTAWLAATDAIGPERLVVAIETMSLVDFDELPVEVSHAANEAMLSAVSQLTPNPSHTATIDGPYLMATWDHASPADIINLNRAIVEAMAHPVDTPHGAVVLTGSVAFLRPGPGLDLDGLIHHAVQGLMYAREIERNAPQ